MTAALSLHITEWLLGRVDGAVFCPVAAIKQHLMADLLNLLGSTSMEFHHVGKYGGEYFLFYFMFLVYLIYLFFAKCGTNVVVIIIIIIIPQAEEKCIHNKTYSL